MTNAASGYHDPMHPQLLSILVLLSAAVIAVAVVRRFRRPSMLAYLAVGMALGPHGLALLAENAEVQGFAEFGLVFLMFSIGLEFSLKRLQAMRALVFGFGASQMALTALGTGLATVLAYGQDWKSGIAVGLAVAMSSTVIVARMLSDRFELHSRSGRQTMGVLLFQDLAVAPCLILLPALAASGDDLWRSLAVAAAQAVAVLALLVWLGKRLMGRLFDAMARVRSNELLVLTSLWIVVGLSFLTAQSGLSLALGAFVGGMLISETAYRHHVEADIRPFRDILLGLFFVTIGMMLDLGYVLANAHKLALAVALLIGGKAAVMLLITRIAKTPLVASLRTAAQLAQAGEFGLVLIHLAHQLQLISTSVFQITLSAMLLSMFVAPFLIERAARLSGDLGRGDWAHKATVIHNIAVHSIDLGQHVVICGYGRTGQRIAEFLGVENIPFIALDVDPQRIGEARAQGINAVFGNADRREVLQAAGGRPRPRRGRHLSRRTFGGARAAHRARHATGHPDRGAHRRRQGCRPPQGRGRDRGDPRGAGKQPADRRRNPGAGRHPDEEGHPPRACGTGRALRLAARFLPATEDLTRQFGAACVCRPLRFALKEDKD
jgi:CPA2 family monovalent cation:H+ antiporter-2